jgi:N,N'-diacetyllegionaminate synthase
MGDVDYAHEYVRKIINAKPDGVLFHIREREYYEKKMSLKLPDSYYVETLKTLRNNNIKFGISIADSEKIGFCEKIDVDFYKVFGRDILEFDLLEIIRETRKKVFVSTSMSNMNQIDKFIRFINNSDQFTLIHTQLDNDINMVNLRAISMLKKKYQMNVAYGNHCNDPNVIYLSLAYEPSDLLFYVKGKKTNSHVDESHAFDIDYLSEIVQNLQNLPRAIGKEVKIKMGRNIN